MHRDRAESAGKAHRCGHRHLRYRTPKPSEVIHGLITSLAAMRWPIATGSSMRSVTFQIDDELMRASLYKGPHPALPPSGGGSYQLVIEWPHSLGRLIHRARPKTEARLALEPRARRPEARRQGSNPRRH